MESLSILICTDAISPHRNCPFSCKSFNLSWIQIGCFILSAYRECCLSMAPQNPLLLFLPVSLASIVLRSEASSPFVAVSSGGTRAGGDHRRQEEAVMMLLPLSSSPALCCTCSLSAPISKKAKSHVLSSSGSRKLAVFNLVEWFLKKLPVRDAASLYTQGQDLVKHLDCTLESVTGLKHNSSSDTIAHSHIWSDILLPFQPCDVLSSPAWKDLTTGYFVKAFLGKTHPKPRCSLSSLLNIVYL